MPVTVAIWINYFSRRILERVLVGNIVNIRNECLFFWVHGVWIVARNKQITREPLRGSRDLFVPRYDSYPMNPEKRHSFLNSALSRLTDLGIYDITWCGIWLLTIFHMPYIHFQRELWKVTSPKWYLSFLFSIYDTLYWWVYLRRPTHYLLLHCIARVLNAANQLLDYIPMAKRARYPAGKPRVAGSIPGGNIFSFWIFALVSLPSKSWPWCHLKGFRKLSVHAIYNILWFFTGWHGAF